MKSQAKQKVSEKQAFIEMIDKVLLDLADFNRLSEKSLLNARYYKHQETHEKRILSANIALFKHYQDMQDYFNECSFKGKLGTYGKSLLAETNQLRLDLLSLACLRFRVGDDPEAFKVKSKLITFMKTLSDFIETLTEFRKRKNTRPNLQLLERQLEVLIEAFYDAYPLDHEHEYEFELDTEELNDDLLLMDDEAVTLKYDDGHAALQGFISGAHIALHDLAQLIAALEHWRGES